MSIAKTVQKSLSIKENRQIETPKPLEQLREGELERKRHICKIMTFTLKYLTNELINHGFEWLLPVVFSKTTDPLWPDPGASIEERVEVEIYGNTVRTTQSMIVHKMVACSLVQPRLFVLSPNVRIEKRERAASGVHAYEFTQLDFESREASSKDVRSLVENVLSGLVANMKTHLRKELAYLGRDDGLTSLCPPFRVCDKRELEREYGEAWETRLLWETRDAMWVTNIPREFYDFEDEDGRWDNYDLLLPMYGEVLSGGKREWEYSKLVKKMQRDNVRQERFKLLLKLAKEKKLKPSAGAGIGIERLTSWITGAKHLGETQLFPRVPGIVYDL
ncbi:MAG: asparagine synthetase A [Candidatus Bathyarchaeota archaeon]|nr:asparagine synthetase A [Candidatus Bathyarchaeota archaeon]